MMKRSLIFFLGLSFLTSSSAAKLPELSLQEAIYLALRYNVSIKKGELDRVTQKYDLAIAYHGLMPHLTTITGSTNYSEYKVDGSKSYSESYSLTPNATFKTPLNSDVDVSFYNNYDGARYNQGLGVTITQPLLRGFGPDLAHLSLLNAIDAEKLRQLELKRTVADQVKKVINSYYNVLKDINSLKLNQISLQNSLDRLKEAEVREKIGRLSGLDLLQTRTNIPRDQLSVSSAQTQLVQDKNSLLSAIGLQSDFGFTIPQTIQVKIVKPPSFEQCLQTALANNMSYQSGLVKIKQAERDLHEAEDKGRWKLNLKTTLTTGSQGSPINSAMLFDGANNSKSVGVDLEIPLDRLSIKRDIAVKKIALQKERMDFAQTKRQIELDVASKIDSLKSAEQQIQLALTSRDYYAKLLAVEQKKLELGRASVFQLNSFQRDYVNYEQQVINNQIAYLNALVELQDLLGTLLQEWKIAIRY